jgi:hypothetical protein
MKQKTRGWNGRKTLCIVRAYACGSVAMRPLSALGVLLCVGIGVYSGDATSQTAIERAPSFEDMSKNGTGANGTGAAQPNQKVLEARVAQSIARDIADMARQVAKNADNIAASARKTEACGPAGSKTGLAVVCAGGGARYYGQLKNGQYEGLGVFVSAAGDVIKGQWQAGRPEGVAVTISKTGYVVEGQVRAGKAAGYGRAIGEFGRYEGEWQDGNWNGLGVKVTTAEVSEGRWRDGKFDAGQSRTF